MNIALQTFLWYTWCMFAVYNSWKNRLILHCHNICPVWPIFEAHVYSRGHPRQCLVHRKLNATNKHFTWLCHPLPWTSIAPQLAKRPGKIISLCVCPKFPAFRPQSIWKFTMTGFSINSAVNEKKNVNTA